MVSPRIELYFEIRQRNFRAFNMIIIARLKSAKEFIALLKISYAGLCLGRTAARAVCRVQHRGMIHARPFCDSWHFQTNGLVGSEGLVARIAESLSRMLYGPDQPKMILRVLPLHRQKAQYPVG
jgi:hypothetical protein